MASRTKSATAAPPIAAAARPAAEAPSIALFRCVRCATVEQANGGLLAEYADFDPQGGWWTPCPVCGGVARLETQISFPSGNAVVVERDGRSLSLPSNLIAAIADAIYAYDAQSADDTPLPSPASARSAT